MFTNNAGAGFVAWQVVGNVVTILIVIGSAAVVGHYLKRFLQWMFRA